MVVRQQCANCGHIKKTDAKKFFTWVDNLPRPDDKVARALMKKSLARLDVQAELKRLRNENPW